MVYVTDDNLFHFYNGSAWTAIGVPDGDGSASNELQSLSRSGTNITLSNGGGTVSIADNDNDPGNELDSKWTSASGAIHHNDGSVGIGTASPGALLHVQGSDSTESSGLLIGNTSGASRIYINDTSDLVLRKSSVTNQLVLDASGYIGIQTETPSSELDVNGSVRIRGGNPAAGKVLTAIDSNGTANWQTDGDRDSANELQSLSRSGTTVSLSDSGGSVSIADNDNDSTNEIQTLSKSGTTVSLSDGGGSVSIADDDNDPTNELDSKWDNIATGINRSSGNVGIGVTDPSQKLDINGRIRIREGFPAADKFLRSTGSSGEAVWEYLTDYVSKMASTEGGGTTQVTRGGSGTTWDNTSYSALLSNLTNGDRVLVFASFLLKLNGGSGTDKAAFRIEADNQSGGSQYSTSTGTIDDLQRDKWVLYSFHRFFQINQGSGNYRFYLQVDESLTDDPLIFDQQEISVIKF
jgi:hypothetical protein